MNDSVHKFSCSQGHEFYIPLNLPKPIEDVSEIFKRVRCPLCYDTDINLNFALFMLTETGKQ